jgi:hypothetical protein
LPLAFLEEPYDRLFWGATAIALAIALACVLKWILATWRQSRLLRPTGHDPAPPAGSPRGAAAMRLAGHPSKAAANRQPDALLAELERTRAEFERAERAARTYLVGQGVLDQTQVDLVAALKRSDFKAE